VIAPMQRMPGFSRRAHWTYTPSKNNQRNLARIAEPAAARPTQLSAV